MKIEKGYTLSQFVDWVAENDEDCWLCKDIPESELEDKFFGNVIAEKIFDYNNRLKEPLIKDVFINPYEKPLKPMGYDTWKQGNGGADGIACVNYENALKQYEEAEKKVIFKGWSKSINFKYLFINGVNEMDFTCDGFIKYNGIVVQTLGDLFRATNGELELKNFEI